MKRYLSSLSLYIGQLIVVSDADDAQVYTIGHFDNDQRERTTVFLLWREGTRLCGCNHDSYMLKKPSLKQIENSILTGALVSSKEITTRS